MNKRINCAQSERGSIIGSLISEIHRKKYNTSEIRGKCFKNSESEQHFGHNLIEYHNYVIAKK